MHPDTRQPALDSDEWLSRQETGAAQELAAMNGYCRALLLGALLLGVLFVAAVAYLAVIHSA